MRSDPLFWTCSLRESSRKSKRNKKKKWRTSLNHRVTWVPSMNLLIKSSHLLWARTVQSVSVSCHLLDNIHPRLIVGCPLLRSMSRKKHWLKRRCAFSSGTVFRMLRFQSTLSSSSYWRTQTSSDLSPSLRTSIKWQWPGAAITGSSKAYISRRTSPTTIALMIKEANPKKVTPI
jgi:hypothetical protein